MKVAAVRALMFNARMRTGDPASSVYLLTPRWEAEPQLYAGEDVVIGWWGNALCLNVGGELFYMPARVGEPDGAGTSIKAWGLEKLAPGVWTVQPSLLQPGSLHCYIVLYGAPDPASWEVAA